MGRIDGLVEKYRETIAAPWISNIAAPQRVIFVVYPPTEERRLRYRLGEFELATRESGHEWHSMDLTNSFDEWLADHEYRQLYFEAPDSFVRDSSGDLRAYSIWLVEQVASAAREQNTDSSVFALWGLGSLFGFTHVSRLLESTKQYVKGRYVLFFPGDLQGNNYRMLDARDGWNYLALAISEDKD
jgi:hypothetical protein